MEDQPATPNLVERALDECIEHVRNGGVYKFEPDPGVLNKLRGWCRVDFDKMLNDPADPTAGPRVWAADGELVRKMSWWVGVCARFVAEVRHPGKKEINESDAKEGLLVVQKYCTAMATERKYCLSVPPAESEI